MHSTFHRLIRIAFWCSAAALVIASLMPVDLLPPQAASIWDKGQHAFGFAWLALLGLLAFEKRPWTVVVGLVILGGVVELLQAATGWRYGEWLDFLADGVGIVFGATLWLAWRRLPTPPR
ncbi:MAG: VanZ family protein [Hydrogenophaga sp.]|uniref:VanZ family protein n=1 Tax=Hydrogenophaga sp. TaxID=1904254 RepID=UPI002613F05D|nr:VanZ family protein [Hydrogenophaga sp.]MDM7942988.1 VanZ family protein [Hydrogenophaga sp.]